jgi:hypothetical protein
VILISFPEYDDQDAGEREHGRCQLSHSGDQAKEDYLKARGEEAARVNDGNGRTGKTLD